MARRPPLVRKLIGAQVHLERGSLDVADRERVAVLAQWSAGPRMSLSVRRLVADLQVNGYFVVVSSSCQSRESLEWGSDVDFSQLAVLRKPNVGYDFGSWCVALSHLPGVHAVPRVILANDSMIGPFRPLHDVLAKFDATPADVWGLTDTQQWMHHVQSYVLGFREGVLADRPLSHFWSNIRHHADKNRIIFENEVGLGRLLREEGYVWAVAYPHERYVHAGQNPVIVGWKALLEDGFPFLKREIVRNPSVAPAGDSAPSVLARLLGVTLADWVDDTVVAV